MTATAGRAAEGMAIIPPFNFKRLGIWLGKGLPRMSFYSQKKTPYFSNIFISNFLSIIGIKKGKLV